MNLFLTGVVIGALLPMVLGIADEWRKRRRQRQRAMNHLRRTIPTLSGR